MYSHLTIWIAASICFGRSSELPFLSFAGSGEGVDHEHKLCCSGSYYGDDEKAATREWYNKVASDWDDVYEKEFTLWNEFDIQRASEDSTFKEWADAIKQLDVSPENLETWLADPVGICKSSMQDVRWNMGYQYTKTIPDMVDWDDKIAKKEIVAALQPEDDKILWYTPNIYAGYFPGFLETEAQVHMMEMAVAKFFESNPNDLVFLKSAVAGMGGSGLQSCTARSSTPGALFKLAREDFLKNVDNDGTYPYPRYPVLRGCANLVLQSIKSLSTSYLGMDVNPAIKYGWGGLVIEPGFPHIVEFKTVVIWGKFFAGGTETPHCCGFRTADFTPMRGDATFGIGKQPDSRDYASHMAKVNEVVTEDVWKRLVMIAETVASHADYARVDLFVNDKGEVRVNEIEGYFQCKHTAMQQNDVAVGLHAALWVRGWQKFLKQQEEAKKSGSQEANLQVQLRQIARGQQCVATSRGGELKQVQQVFPMYVVVVLSILLIGFIATSAGLIWSQCQLKQLRAATQKETSSVEMTSSDPPYFG